MRTLKTHPANDAAASKLKRHLDDINAQYDEFSDHKVGRTIVSSSDDYKVYCMTGGEEEEQEPTDEVYRTIEGGTRKTSIAPPLLL